MDALGLRFGRPHTPFVTMIRWLLVTFLALVIFSGLQPWLQKLGFGRLPGDLHFKLFGRVWSIPFASTILLSLIAAGVAKWL